MLFTARDANDELLITGQQVRYLDPTEYCFSVGIIIDIYANQVVVISGPTGIVKSDAALCEIV